MNDKICTNCGTRLSTYYKTGMLGCARCYDAITAEIASTLTDIQSKAYHVGKTPKCSTEDKKLLGEYRRLLSAKETCAIEGRFADMAIISRDIFALQEELKKRGLI